MGKKHKRSKEVLLSDIFGKPARNPFGEADESTLEGSLLTDLQELGKADTSDISISDKEWEEGYTSAPFPSWKVSQAEAVSQASQQETTEPVQQKSTGKTDEMVYEYDVAEYLANH